MKQTHLLFGDTQYPDVDEGALEAVLQLAGDLKPDYVWLMGDMLNATTVSKYGHPADYKISFWDEIRGTRTLIKDIVDRIRKTNSKTKIAYLEGNHEFRLQKYIDRNANQLAELADAQGNRYLSIEHLLDLQEIGVSFVPYWHDATINEKVTLLHGNIARAKSGYTAHAYIDRYGQSTVAGHTHRLALIFKTQSGQVRFGMETGSLCKRDMVVPYTRFNQADWQQGAGIVLVEDGKVYPSIHPIVEGKISYGGKIYGAEKVEEVPNTIFRFDDFARRI